MGFLVATDCRGNVYLEDITMEIRKITADDYHLIREINTDDERMKALIVGVSNQIKDYSSDVLRAYVAVTRGKTVGFVYGFVLPNRLLLPQYMYLEPKFRGNYLGQALLEALEKDSGCVQAIIYFESPLSEYYQRQGYEVGNAVVAMKALSRD